MTERSLYEHQSRLSSYDEDDVRVYPDFAPWSIFGEYPDGKTVDVEDLRHGPIMFGVPREMAHEVIAARERFFNEITRILNDPRWATK